METDSKKSSGKAAAARRALQVRLIAFGVLALLVASGLASLGVWQLERAQAKADLLAGIDRALALEPSTLAAAEAAPLGARFHSVVVSGRFDPTRQILLDNQLQAGQPGVRAYVPFLLDDGRVLLADRGWLAWPDRAQPPPQAEVSDLPQQLDGILLDPPGAGYQLAAAPNAGWPFLTTRMVMAEIDGRLSMPLLEWVLEDRRADRALSIRAGMLPPERHRGYAVQWFGLSIAVIVIYLTLAWRSRRRHLS